MTERKRLIDLLTATDEYLDSKGIESPRRNAEALFAKTLKLPRIELYLQHDRPIKDSELAELRDLIRQRTKRVPLQYLVGSVDFYSAQISVKPGLLIPRPETEELVATLLPLIPEHARVLDIGCGSGCIAVAIAKAREDCSVLAVDIDDDAAQMTQANAVSNRVAERTQAIKADVFSNDFCNIIRCPFDVIVSNPPYIREDELAALEPEVREFENRHALVSGPTGLEFFERIAELLPVLLSSGILALEFGMSQTDQVRSLFAPLLSSLMVYKDLQGKDRYLIGCR